MMVKNQISEMYITRDDDLFFCITFFSAKAEKEFT